jgi:hypothetical protein
MSPIDIQLAQFYREIAALEGTVPTSPMRTCKTTEPPLPATPAEVRLAHEAIISLDPRVKATPGRGKVIDVGLRVLTTLTSPKKSKYAASFREGIFSPESVTPGSADASRRAYKFLRGPGQDWVGSVIKTTNRVTLETFLGIDLAHILTLKRGVGFHFCKASDSRFAVISEKHTNPETGVWSGVYKGKLSSFFPQTIRDPDALTQVLLKAEILGSYRKGERAKCLAFASHCVNSFYILMYQEKEATINTAFPLFYAKDVVEIGEDIQVEGVFSVKKADVLAQLSALSPLEKEDRIEITLTSGKHLLRLCGLRGIPFEKGIYLIAGSEDIGGYRPSWT